MMNYPFNEKSASSASPDLMLTTLLFPDAAIRRMAASPRQCGRSGKPAPHDPHHPQNRNLPCDGIPNNYATICSDPRDLSGPRRVFRIYISLFLRSIITSVSFFHFSPPEARPIWNGESEGNSRLQRRRDERSFCCAGS